MSNNFNVIARPYANAAFEFAKEQQQIEKWQQMLADIADLSDHYLLKQLSGNPEIEEKVIAEIYIDILGKQLTQEAMNFIRILAENNRLGAIAAINKLFQEYSVQAEQQIAVVLATAKPINTEVESQVKSALVNKLNKHISMTCEIDESLIGGAVIQIGDLIIDGSIKGKLKRLAHRLAS